MEQTEKFVSGVEETKYECIWKICKYPLIQQTEQHLADQQIEFEIGQHSNNCSKWRAGLRADLNNKLEVYFKLLEVQSPTATFWVQGNIQYSKFKEPATFNQLSQLRPSQVLMSSEVVLSTSGSVNKKPSTWLSSCDPEGCLYLRIRLGVLSSFQKSRQVITEFDSASIDTLQKDFAKMCRFNDHASDMILICKDGKKLRAHKFILAARNYEFQSFLQSGICKKPQSTVKISDVSSIPMKLILYYFYTGELLRAYREPEIIHEFTYAVGRFQIEEILDLLDQELGTGLIPVYDFKLLMLAKDLELNIAIKRLTEKIVENVGNVKTADKLLKLFCIDDCVEKVEVPKTVEQKAEFNIWDEIKLIAADASDIRKKLLMNVANALSSGTFSAETILNPLKHDSELHRV